MNSHAPGSHALKGRATWSRLGALVGTTCLCLAAMAQAPEAAPVAQADPAAIDAHIDAQHGALGLPSVSVGIVHGDELVYTRCIGFADAETRRAVDADTLYGIGSITKVFTTTLLAVLRDEGVVNLDDPLAFHIRERIAIPTDPRGAPNITLRHLATHTSGLPRLPGGIDAAAADPYASYDSGALLGALSETTLESPIGARVAYSNFGVALLGLALERAADKPYADLLRERIFIPLGMNSSALTLEDSMRDRFAIGYTDAEGKDPAIWWTLSAFAPAGAIVSSVNDMAEFLSMQMHAGEAGALPVSGGTLTELHTPQRLMPEWKMGVGLGWIIQPHETLGDVVWHNGGLAGHSSWMGFVPARDVGVVVLTNRAAGVDALGMSVLEMAVEAFAPEQTLEIDPRLREVLAALQSQFIAQPTEVLAAQFHAEFLKNIPAERVAPIFSSMAAQRGACTGFRAKPGPEAPRMEVEFLFEKGPPLRCHVAVAPDAEAKITYLRILP